MRNMKMFCILGIFLAQGCKEKTTSAPALPRPTPDQNFDRVSKIVILNKSKAVLENPKNDEAWKSYGDACLMNGWFWSNCCVPSLKNLDQKRPPDEAYSLRVATPTIDCCLRLFPRFKRFTSCVTIAVWHFKMDHWKATTWLDKASLENSARSQTNHDCRAKRAIHRGQRTSSSTDSTIGTKFGAICCRLRHGPLKTMRYLDNHRWNPDPGCPTTRC